MSSDAINSGGSSGAELFSLSANTTLTYSSTRSFNGVATYNCSSSHATYLIVSLSSSLTYYYTDGDNVDYTSGGGLPQAVSSGGATTVSISNARNGSSLATVNICAYCYSNYATINIYWYANTKGDKLYVSISFCIIGF